MKHDPVRPAPLDDVGGHLVVSAYRDRVEASAVGEFLTGNDLPGRWRGRARYVVLATGFGTGAAFLRTWRTWRDDPSRCERLVFLAVEPRPLGRDDLQRWHAAQSPSDDTPAALCTAWPALTPDLHRLSFDADRVQLLLAFGALRRWLPEWVAAVDGFYLDGMGGAADADASEDARRFVDTARQCKALARLAARGAALAAPRPAPQLAGPLRSAGFEVGPTPPGEPLQARYAPRFEPRRSPRSAAASDDRHAIIVGAGLAGCAAACALAQQGWRSTLIERHGEVAAEASGNPAGLFHGIVNADDGAHARFGRAAALAVVHDVERAVAHGVAGACNGLLRLEKMLDVEAMAGRLARLGLPPDYVRAVDARAASAIAGVTLRWPCWFYPSGGWIAPGGLAADYVRRAGSLAVVRHGLEVGALAQSPVGWQLLDRQGRSVAQAGTVILANGFDALGLLGVANWPVSRLRGQISMTAESTWASPRVPIAGSGYVLPAPGGGALFGATSQRNDADPEVRAVDHAHNLARLADLMGRPLDLQPSALEGRVAWRCSAADRLPVIGAVPDQARLRGRLDQARLVPRRPGLFVFTGLGSRGITWSALGGHILAAWVTGAPMPVPASLLDALDPARFGSYRSG